MSLSTSLEVTLGPVPCNECHSPLYFIAGKWQERHYKRTGSGGQAILQGKGTDVVAVPLPTMVRVYQDHHCTAREGNPVVNVLPKGKQGRGGHWRKMVGLPRRRRAPKGRPELT